MEDKLNFTIVAPCFNEEENIFPLVKSIKNFLELNKLNAELILVDDGSIDTTYEKAIEMQKNFKNIKVIKNEKNKGIFSSWRIGVNAARSEIIILIDGDLQNPVFEIKNLYNRFINSSSDIVIGSRKYKEDNIDIRYFFSKGLCKLLNIFFSTKLKDAKSGFVCSYKDTLNDILNFKFSYFFPQTFINISAIKKGYNYNEVDTLFFPRILGKSFLPMFPMKEIILILFDIFLAFIEFRFFTKKKSDLERFISNYNINIEDNTPLFSKIKLFIYFILTPFHKWNISRDFYFIYKALKKSQYLDREDLEKYQLLKLKKLIRHAYGQNKYYRSIFEKNSITPESIKSIDDLKKIPPLEKNDLRKNLYKGIISKDINIENLYKISTSGSTGEPTILYVNNKQLEFRFASTLRSMEWTGNYFGDKSVRLWHQTLGMSQIQIIKERIDAFLSNRVFFSAYQMSEKNLPNILKKIKKLNPKIIDGYAESFNYIANYLEKNENYNMKVNSIVTSAQILPLQVRNLIKKKFNCEIFDKYGSREFSGIAYEDKSQSGHLVQMESYIVEIVKNGNEVGPNENGEILITDLNNLSLPFIRYKIGDIAEKIDQGPKKNHLRKMQRIGNIIGRTQAIVICKNGTCLPGTFFAHFFKDYSNFIAHYQVVQNEIDALNINCVTLDMYNHDFEKFLSKELQKYTGKDMVINFKKVKEIPLLETGKRTAVISNINYNFHNLNI
tara:strand:+ start:2396 stop:4570 length:2175 start_codon:yes stop_codon:yes gene_type:complete